MDALLKDPRWNDMVHMAKELSEFFAEKGIEEWQLCGVRNRFSPKKSITSRLTALTKEVQEMEFRIEQLEK